jgi:hypothetical protein
MTNAVRPSGHTSVMQQRHHAPPDELDFFPTPPWSVRAFLKVLEGFEPALASGIAWEPACGAGHMAAVLKERFGAVCASDIFAHPWLAPDHLRIARRPGRVDFLGEIENPPPADWIITNPPFQTALDFALRGLALANRGVALLVRTSWVEGADRFERLFRPHPPTAVVQYCERVAMTRGRWEPNASTATSYCWVVWVKGESGPTQFRWIPPGSKKRFSRPEDLVFAAEGAAPLLEGLPE